MEYIDSMTAPPVAGRFYMVPTIRCRWNRCTGVYPVIGPKHEDAEIIGHASKFLIAACEASGRFKTAVDVGSGTNLYPGLLMLPYLLWVSIATALTAATWHLNPGIL